MDTRNRPGQAPLSDQHSRSAITSSGSDYTSNNHYSDWAHTGNYGLDKVVGRPSRDPFGTASFEPLYTSASGPPSSAPASFDTSYALLTGLESPNKRSDSPTRSTNPYLPYPKYSHPSESQMQTYPATTSNSVTSRYSSAPSLGTFQPFCVYKPRSANSRAPPSAMCTAMLDACAFGPDNNSVSAYFLHDEFDLSLDEGEIIVLRIVATDHGPVQKGLEYRETFVVKNRGQAPLLLGRDWIEKRWEDCTFFTMKAGTKKQNVQSPEDLAEIQRRDELRQQLASQRSNTSTAGSLNGPDSTSSA